MPDFRRTAAFACDAARAALSHRSESSTAAAAAAVGGGGGGDGEFSPAASESASNIRQPLSRRCASLSG